MFTPGASLHSTQVPKPQFRAVILCGYGSDLYPLIEPTSGMSDDDEGARSDTGGAARMSRRAPGQVKALLPVAGKRMVDWILDRVEEAGVYGEYRCRTPGPAARADWPCSAQTSLCSVQILSAGRWCTTSAPGEPACQLACPRALHRPRWSSRKSPKTSRGPARLALFAGPPSATSSR